MRVFNEDLLKHVPVEPYIVSAHGAAALGAANSTFFFDPPKDLQPESRAKLGPKGMKLAEIVGELAAKKVDEILAEVNKSGR